MEAVEPTPTPEPATEATPSPSTEEAAPAETPTAPAPQPTRTINPRGQADFLALPGGHYTVQLAHSTSPQGFKSIIATMGLDPT